ncbi:hypothetical protein THAOC_32937 [Thalassiosira oceanica]|uniref:Uncharacterized protein n=1 Tax=Thalassiosira oceanica TaxID=159749 RepID=K0R4Z6_THAOC|nr:hypothetical protein THAOC_32937 [Thalassiosira oceanica]|eukprot:EJK48283.1 hypothetical protein THAOC_32937 [Thalassiosira oceanica]
MGSRSFRCYEEGRAASSRQQQKKRSASSSPPHIGARVRQPDFGREEEERSARASAAAKGPEDDWERFVDKLPSDYFLSAARTAMATGKTPAEGDGKRATGLRPPSWTRCPKSPDSGEEDDGDGEWREKWVLDDAKGVRPPFQAARRNWRKSLHTPSTTQKNAWPMSNATATTRTGAARRRGEGRLAAAASRLDISVLRPSRVCPRGSLSGGVTRWPICRARAAAGGGGGGRPPGSRSRHDGSWGPEDNDESAQGGDAAANDDRRGKPEASCTVI